MQSADFDQWAVQRLVRSNSDSSSPHAPGSHRHHYENCITGNVVFDEGWNVLFVAKSLRLAWGLASEECRGTLGVLLSRLFARMPDAADALLQSIESMLEQESFEDDTTVLANWNSGLFLVNADLSQIENRNWNLSLQIQSGLQKRKPVVQHDPLTGIANRATFEEQLDLALSELGDAKTTLPIFFLDLDRFKAVNDTLGHAVGDTLLKLVSERLKTALQVSDVLGRLGGDEFAIILHDQPKLDEVGQLAGKLIDLIQRPFLIDGQVVNVGASIGVAVAPIDGLTRTELLRSADLALYHSKNAGRGTSHFFDPLMRERAQERRMLELDLRKALVLRQFELHYQPQIEVETETIIGLEGLLRWRHPKRGLLLPATFLSLAEEIGLAVSIGEWVVKTACAQAARWPDGITVAVNVSPLQFESASFVESTQKSLKQAALSGSRLEIEVTEQILLQNRDAIGSKLEALKAMGIRVVMDSFGTGLASLSQLVTFPFDKVKIDRSLVGHGGFDAKTRAILRAISALGQSLGIATLATGVETREHLASVQAEGCQSVQGFYYSDAVPAKGLESLLKAFPARDNAFVLQETA